MTLLTRSVTENWCVLVEILRVTNLVGTTVMKYWYVWLSTGKQVSHSQNFGLGSRRFNENQHPLRSHALVANKSRYVGVTLRMVNWPEGEMRIRVSRLSRLTPDNICWCLIFP